jgi:hypothetical protein
MNNKKLAEYEASQIGYSTLAALHNGINFQLREG